MKKGLAILLILSSTIYAGVTDDFEDFSQAFAWFFKEDSKSPVQRVKSQSSLEAKDPDAEPIEAQRQRRMSFERAVAFVKKAKSALWRLVLIALKHY